LDLIGPKNQDRRGGAAPEATEAPRSGGRSWTDRSATVEEPSLLITSDNLAFAMMFLPEYVMRVALFQMWFRHKSVGIE
jgi:hypothetical protein